jgi:hypothetical protein
MKTIPLPIQTVYADLVQQLQAVEDVAASVTTRTIRGRDYLRANYRVGTKLREIYLGAVGDADAEAWAERIRSEATRAKTRRKTVQLLRRSLGGPSPELGQVLAVLADAGIFRTKEDGSYGAVLVGTAAFQCYSGMLGRQISGAALMTADADLATAHLALSADDHAHDEEEDHHDDDAGDDDEQQGDDHRRPGRPPAPISMEAILQRANPTFRGVPQLNPRDPPSMFRSDEDFVVDILTPTRIRNDTNPLRLPALNAGAMPLQYLDWLINDPVPAAVLWGSGILVPVPDPVRYCVHKLIIASVRTTEKREKDLMQASVLLQILQKREPDRLDDLLDDARSQGDKWREAIDSSLDRIGQTGTLLA